MPEPSKKSPAMEQFISNVMGKDRQATIRRGGCMTCDGPATEFRNERSQKEYTISGMCQKCQDSVYGVD